MDFDSSTHLKCTLKNKWPLERFNKESEFFGAQKEDMEAVNGNELG